MCNVAKGNHALHLQEKMNFSIYHHSEIVNIYHNALDVEYRITEGDKLLWNE